MSLQRLDWQEIEGLDRGAITPETLVAAAEIVEAVRVEGEAAARRYGERFGEISPGDNIVIERPELDRASDELSPSDRELLQRTADRIEATTDV